MMLSGTIGEITMAAWAIQPGIPAFLKLAESRTVG
jgi:hypothetical protein